VSRGMVPDWAKASRLPEYAFIRRQISPAAVLLSYGLALVELRIRRRFSITETSAVVLVERSQVYTSNSQTQRIRAIYDPYME